MLECIDLYCGAGGLSLGLTQAGLKVRAAIDLSADCEVTHGMNLSGTKFIRMDINDLHEDDLLAHVRNPEKLVLAGGPPCQLFSRLNRNANGQPHGLRPYVRLVRRLTPAYVVFENVPAIMRQGVAWNYLIDSLKRLKYKVSFGVIKAVEFGVPQRRERVIVLAARESIALPKKNVAARTVWDTIGHLPFEDEEIPNHVGMQLSPANLQKIKKLEPGGNSRQSRTSFADSYARMEWNLPAPTITTKCISFSNGRFGHPKYNRAITVREAALLQGFPPNFEFHGSLWSCARQVGNAVPPPIARALGEQILSHATATRKRRAA